MAEASSERFHLKLTVQGAPPGLKKILAMRNPRWRRLSSDVASNIVAELVAKWTENASQQADKHFIRAEIGPDYVPDMKSYWIVLHYDNESARDAVSEAITASDHAQDVKVVDYKQKLVSGKVFGLDLSIKDGEELAKRLWQHAGLNGDVSLTINPFLIDEEYFEGSGRFSCPRESLVKLVKAGAPQGFRKIIWKMKKFDKVGAKICPSCAKPCGKRACSNRPACAACGNGDHTVSNCPDRNEARTRDGCCLICHRAGHFFFECPDFTSYEALDAKTVDQLLPQRPGRDQKSRDPEPQAAQQIAVPPPVNAAAPQAPWAGRHSSEEIYKEMKRMLDESNRAIEARFQRYEEETKKRLATMQKRLMDSVQTSLDRITGQILGSVQAQIEAAFSSMTQGEQPASARERDDDDPYPDVDGDVGRDVSEDGRADNGDADDADDPVEFTPSKPEPKKSGAKPSGVATAQILRLKLTHADSKTNLTDVGTAGRTRRQQATQAKTALQREADEPTKRADDDDTKTSEVHEPAGAGKPSKPSTTPTKISAGKPGPKGTTKPSATVARTESSAAGKPSKPRNV